MKRFLSPLRLFPHRHRTASEHVGSHPISTRIWLRVFTVILVLSALLVFLGVSGPKAPAVHAAPSAAIDGIVCQNDSGNSTFPYTAFNDVDAGGCPTFQWGYANGFQPSGSIQWTITTPDLANRPAVPAVCDLSAFIPDALTGTPSAHYQISTFGGGTSHTIDVIRDQGTVSNQWVELFYGFFVEPGAPAIEVHLLDDGPVNETIAADSVRYHCTW